MSGIFSIEKSNVPGIQIWRSGKVVRKIFYCALQHVKIASNVGKRPRGIDWSYNGCEQLNRRYPPMNSFTNITSIIVLSASAVLLSACGGGSSSVGTNVAPSAAVNLLAPLTGTYLVACTRINPESAKLESEQASIIVTPDATTNGATVSMHARYYAGSIDCAAATLDTDLTVSGQLSDMGSSKNFSDATGKTLSAKVASFTYSGLTLSKGNLSGSLPTFGAKALIAYVLIGNNLLVSKGHRDVNGVGDSLSDRVAVKQ